MLTIRRPLHGVLHPSMTPSITTGALAGAMVRGLCPVSSGGSRWESPFHRGGTGVTGQGGIPGTDMVMVTVTSGMAGTPDTVITRIKDILADTMGITVQVTDTPMPTSIDPLTPTDRSMRRGGLHPLTDRFRMSRNLDRTHRNVRGKNPVYTPTKLPNSDRETRHTLLSHNVKHGQGKPRGQRTRATTAVRQIISLPDGTGTFTGKLPRAGSSGHRAAGTGLMQGLNHHRILSGIARAWTVSIAPE